MEQKYLVKPKVNRGDKNNNVEKFESVAPVATAILNTAKILVKLAKYSH